MTRQTLLGWAGSQTPILTSIEKAVAQTVGPLVTQAAASAQTAVAAAAEARSLIDKLPPGAGGPVDWAGVANKPPTFPPAAHSHPISDVSGLQAALDGKAAATHMHGIAGVSGLQAALDGKAAATHGHAIAEVTGLQSVLDGKAAASAIPTTEFLQDLVAAMFQAGTHTNASIAYDDAAGTLNITATSGGTGGATLTKEEVEDFVGGLVVQGTGINVTYDDAGNVLRIALAGESYTTADKNKLAAIAPGATANQTDAHLLARDNHTGTQAISTITGLQGALDGKAATGHQHDISSIAGLQDALDALTAANAAQLAVNAALTARIAALEGGTVVTPPPGPQPDPSPYQPDMTTGRIAPITTSFGGRPNVVPASYYFDGQDEALVMEIAMAAMHTGMVH